MISIIIVNWNVRDTLRANLAQLFALRTEVKFEVIVVDNGSADGSVAMLREEFPQVHRIRNEVNRGFAFACNQGCDVAKGDVILLLNPDMLATEGALEHAVKTLTERREVGVLGVALQRPDGSHVESVRRDPSFKDQLAIVLKLPHLFPKVVDRYLAKDFDYTQSQEVQQVRGSFFAFRRDVYEQVGRFDAEHFFLWFEEVDFCKRVRAAGYKVWYSAEVVCTDLVGQSFRQVSVARKQARMLKSMAAYLRKWGAPWQAWVILALRPWCVALGAIVGVLRLRSALWK